MSLLGKLGGALMGGVGGFLTGGPAGAIAGAVMGGMGSGGKQSSVMPGVGRISPIQGNNALSASGAVRSVVAIARSPVGRMVSRAAPYVGAAAAVGGLLYDQFGNQVRRRRRRMNPMNARAARRAIRRIKGARKMLQNIERQLPKARAPVRRAPARASNVHEFIRQG